MSTRFAVMTDVHANLPALEAVLAAIREAGCDAIYHTGDAIAIGPHPAECLDLMLDTPDLTCVMGNHDAWFAFGIPGNRPPHKTEDGIAHQLWTNAQIDSSLASTVGAWPFVIDREIEGFSVRFCHYALDESGSNWLWFGPNPEPADFDRSFGQSTDLVFYGHDHTYRDLTTANARYVNPGALGCFEEPIARFALVELERGRIVIDHRRVPYDDSTTMRDLELRDVPDREFILRRFFGRG